MKKLKNNKHNYSLFNKAFTLIELLAVIIILAIVALIAVPIILNVVEDAKISAGRSEANMIYSGINNYCSTEDVKAQMDEDYVRICTSSLDAEKVKEMVNLGNAAIESIKYNGSKLTELIIKSNNHIFTLCPSGTFAMDDEKCEESVGILTKGPIKDIVLSNFPYLKTNGNGCMTPNDYNYSYMGGCYIKGNPNNNYIWYSGFLWRIMGINADGTVRLITGENVTGIPWGTLNSAQNWDNNHAKQWLNDYFYSKIKGNNIIKEVTWCSETTTDSSSMRTICTKNLSNKKSKVGLMTIDEYNLAGGSGSYLNIGQWQWTMTPGTGTSAVWGVRNDGNIYTDAVLGTYGLRAVINVNSDANITGGSGTLGTAWSNESGPYILNEEKNMEVTGKLNEKATSGEYVMFAGKKYRVVDKDNNGNTKLILDGYYEEGESIFETKYGDDNIFSITTGIGQKLNGDVLNWLTSNNDTETGKLVSNYTWYQNNFTSGNSYTVSLDEENPTRSINATVGLIRVGEMLSSQSSSILTKGYTTISSYNNATAYWTMTPDTDSSDVWYVKKDGYTFVSYDMNAIRPVIVIKSDVIITGGNGTWSNPYRI